MNIYRGISALKATSGVRYEEGLYLARLVAARSASVVIEIGSCEGRSACYMAGSMKEHGIKGVIHCVDLWELGVGSTPEKHHRPAGHYQFRKNIEQMGFESYITEHIGSSRDNFISWGHAAQADLVFIDAGHKYEEVFYDSQVWGTAVRKGGFLVFHDTDQEGVSRVIHDLDFQVWQPVDIPAVYDVIGEKPIRVRAFERKG